MLSAMETFLGASHYPEISFNPLEGRENGLKIVEAANLALRKISKSAM